MQRVPTRTLLPNLIKFGWTCSEREEIQDLGQKTLFFTLKIKIGKKFISTSAKGTNENIIAKYDKIWLNMFRTGRDTRFGSKNTVFHLKNWNRTKLYQQKCKGYQQEHYCQIWQNLVEHVPNRERYKFWMKKHKNWNKKKMY